MGGISSSPSPTRGTELAFESFSLSLELIAPDWSSKLTTFPSNHRHVQISIDIVHDEVLRLITSHAWSTRLKLVHNMNCIFLRGRCIRRWRRSRGSGLCTAAALDSLCCWAKPSPEVSEDSAAVSYCCLLYTVYACSCPTHCCCSVLSHCTSIHPCVESQHNTTLLWFSLPYTHALCILTILIARNKTINFYSIFIQFLCNFYGKNVFAHFYRVFIFNIPFYPVFVVTGCSYLMLRMHRFGAERGWWLRSTCRNSALTHKKIEEENAYLINSLPKTISMKYHLRVNDRHCYCQKQNKWQPIQEELKFTKSELGIDIYRPWNCRVSAGVLKHNV